MQPPAVSWGVLLHDAQDLVAIAQQPWRLIPALFVIAGQAILLGQIQRAGAAVRIDGQPLDFSTGQAGTQATFIRALLPVKVYFEEEKLIDKEMRERLQQRPSAPGNGS